MKSLRSFLGSGSLGIELVRGATSAFAGRTLGVLASILVSVVLARVLGPSGYGIYAFVFALITLLALPVNMGVPTLIVRETARGMATGEHARVIGVWLWTTLVILAGSAVVIAVLLGWLWAFGPSMRPERYAAFLWGIPLIPLIALGDARAAALRGLRRIFISMLPEQMLRPLLLVGLVAAVSVMAAERPDAATTLALHVLAAVVSFTTGTFLLLRVRPPELRGTPGSRFEHRAWLRAILPLSMITGLQVVNQNTDLVMLGMFRTDAETGIYRVALTGANLATFGFTAVTLTVQPYMARLYAQGEMRRLRLLASAGALASVVVAVPVVAVFALAGDDLISVLFGDEFSAGHRPLVILGIGQTVVAFFGPVGTLLVMSGHERAIVIGLGVAAVVNVVLNALLIPAFGAEGAATATAISKL